jgi:hypothetical protein
MNDKLKVFRKMLVTGFYESQEWERVRYEALKLSKGHCVCCGSRPTANNPLHVDHIKPRSKFPELALTLSNLQVLCKRCNFGKAAADDTDWRWVTAVDGARLIAAFNLSDEERKARRDLLDRSICGATREEREAAKRILDAIEKHALAAFEEATSEA